MLEIGSGVWKYYGSACSEAFFLHFDVLLLLAFTIGLVVFGRRCMDRRDPVARFDVLNTVLRRNYTPVLLEARSLLTQGKLLYDAYLFRGFQC